MSCNSFGIDMENLQTHGMTLGGMPSMQEVSSNRTENRVSLVRSKRFSAKALTTNLSLSAKPLFHFLKKPRVELKVGADSDRLSETNSEK